MNHSCSLCGANTNQPTCAKCWKAYVDDLHSLFTMLPQVERISRREEHIGGRQQGRHANPAFASAPVDFSAMDLLTETVDVLEEVCRHASLWGGSWRKLIKMMLTHRLQVTQSRDLLRDRERIAKLEQKIRLRLTPPEERIIVGRCLNPDCKNILTTIKGQQEVECPACKSVWQVDAVRAKRREKFHDETLEATPSEAARWVKHITGIYLTREVVAMWVHRKMLAASKTRDGRYAMDMGDILKLAEEFRPRGLH